MPFPMPWRLKVLCFRIFAASFLLSLVYPSAFADNIESLIDDQKAAVKDWIEESEDLPAALQLGNQTGLVLYSPALSRSGPNVLCQSISFDALIDSSSSFLFDKEAVINISRP